MQLTRHVPRATAVEHLQSTGVQAEPADNSVAAKIQRGLLRVRMYLVTAMYPFNRVQLQVAKKCLPMSATVNTWAISHAKHGF